MVGVDGLVGPVVVDLSRLEDWFRVGTGSQILVFSIVEMALVVGAVSE